MIIIGLTLNIILIQHYSTLSALVSRVEVGNDLPSSRPDPVSTHILSCKVHQIRDVVLPIAKLIRNLMEASCTCLIS